MTPDTAEDDAVEPAAPGTDEAVSAQQDRLRAALSAEDAAEIREAAAALHPADLADFIEQISAETRAQLLAALGDALDPEVLSELEEGTRDAVLALLEPEALGAALRGLETDDAAYLLDALEPEEQAAALDVLEAGERAALAAALSYPDYSAGRLMRREMVWAPPFLTVGDMIDQMRAREDLPPQFYEIFVVDPAFRPVGVVSLSRLMGERRHIRLDAIMAPPGAVFAVDQPQEEVAYAFNQYHLVSAPVIEGAGRLVGMITIDDAMQALQEEADEDILRLGGVGDESLGETVATVARSRFPWLVANLATAILASLVIGAFDEAIEQIVALAVLMPIVASMGGNAGTQTLTVAVRALATKDLTTTNAFRIIARETLVGLINGLGFAVVVGAVGYLWFGDVGLGLVLGLAMIITMLAAGLAGILIPIGLDRVGADPALASGVFVTTVTDVVGFFAFLGIAALLLF